MRNGIYLGPPVGRSRRLAWALVLVGSLATVAHVSSFARERARVDALRVSVERQQSAGGAGASNVLGTDGRAVVARLRAAAASGVTVRLSPTEMLQLIESALPDQMALVDVSFDPSSSPPSLLMEATARRDQDVTLLQKRMADSRRVSATQRLGERTSADGTLAVRLQVDLAMER